MSPTVVFSVGAVIFAIVVYGVVIAGGMALGREERRGSPAPNRVPSPPPAASAPGSPVAGDSPSPAA
jgi:hypothetical protein